MTEFDNLKSGYTAIVQFGLATNVGYQSLKCGNEIFHESCKQLVESSNYPYFQKMAMKMELGMLKKALEKEIDTYYHHR